MANYKFSAGTLIDYYNGGVIRSPAFTGFPYADYNDFDSGVYQSPAIEVNILDLVRWIWRVKSWNVEFSQTGDTYQFDSQALNLLDFPDERGILEVVGWELSGDAFFGWGAVINAIGVYGLQSDLFVLGDAITGVSEEFNLDSAVGDTLTFIASDFPDQTAVATELDYWDWA